MPSRIHDYPLLAAPHIRLSGTVDDDMYADFRKQLAGAPADGMLVISMTTLGGDPEVARAMGDDIRIVREFTGRETVFLGKVAVYSAGATFMAAFPPQSRFLTRGQRIARGDLSPSNVADLQLASQTTATDLANANTSRQRETLLRFVRSIVIGKRTLEIECDLTIVNEALADTPATVISTPIGCARTGKRIRLILPAAEEKERPRNPALLKLVAWAFKARREMEKGGTVPEVAARLEVSREHLADMIRTSFLAPSIITAILDGTQPATLTRKHLVQARQVPRDWDAQRRMFGFA